MIICYLVVIASIFAFGYIIGQVNVIYLLNNLHTPFLDQIFYYLTQLGNAFIFVPVLIVAIFYRFSLAIGLIGNVVIQGIIVSIFKRLLFPKAPRPIHFIDKDVICHVQGIHIHHWMSFPSGHTVTIFGLCIFLSLWTKNYWVSLFLLLLATLVGISRMYLAQHFPVDVAFGALFGTAIGVFSVILVENWDKSNWMNQKLILPRQYKN
ncbi:MAG: phosphatase PAP2 family protein [Cyclobacteriaceae bacterium]